MKILFCTTESVPFAKTGGLGDVSYSLPKALKEEGHDVRIIMPLYKSIIQRFSDKLTFIGSYEVGMNQKSYYAGLFTCKHEDIPYYFIDNQQFFDRDGMYGYGDDGERFTYFSKSILDTVCVGHFVADIIHVNDWQTAIIPLLLKDPMYSNAVIRKAKTVFTIHNLKYQGLFPIRMLCDLCGVAEYHLGVEGIEFNGMSNFMKAGIVYADQVNTVSKSYSEEVSLPFFGENLDGVIRRYADKFTGILNGIDYNFFNPKTDKALFVNYSEKDAKTAKQENKITLQSVLRLTKDKDKFLIGMVTRLVREKGIDLLLRVISDILTEDTQLVVIGTGDGGYENSLRSLQNTYSDNLSVQIYFDPTMASRIYAASDLFLMPSLIEPCGLSQMIAMRYGSIPLVRKTGGLADSVKNGKNGFVFDNINAHDMLYKIQEAFDIYKNKNADWDKYVKNAMETRFTWEKSAKAYIKLYKKALGE